MGTPDQYSTGPAMCVVPHVMRYVWINQSHTPTAQKHHSFHVCLVKCPRWPYTACVFHARHRQTTQRHPTHHQRGGPVQWSVSQWLVWYTTNNTGVCHIVTLHHQDYVHAHTHHQPVECMRTLDTSCCRMLLWDTHTHLPYTHHHLPKRSHAQDTKQHSTVLWDAHTVLCVSHSPQGRMCFTCSGCVDTVW